MVTQEFTKEVTSMTTDVVDRLYATLTEGEKQHMANKLHKHGHVAHKARRAAPSISEQIENVGEHLAQCSLADEKEAVRILKRTDGLNVILAVLVRGV